MRVTARAGWAVRSAIVAGLALLAADTALWWWLGNRVAAGFATWQAAEAAQGLRVTAGAPHHAGWPLQATAVLPDVTIATSSGDSWHCGELRLVFKPWRPDVVTAIPVGPQRVQLRDGRMLVVAGTMAVDLPLVPSAGAITRAVAHSVVAVPAQGPSWAAERVSVWLNAMEMDLHADGLVLPKLSPTSPPLPFGGVIESLQLHAQLSAPLPAAEDWRSALAAWQAAGGQLQLSGLRLDWGSLQAQGSALLKLTPALQPEGDGSVRLAGYSEAVAAMQHAGLMTRNAAQVAEAVFGLLAKTEPGKPPVVDLPLHLEAGVVSAGPVPLLRVPDVSLQ